MTDKEVSKLNRRDLLELLLETQTENESLRTDCEALKQQVSSLTEALEKSEDALRRANAVSASADWQATTLLKEARETADSVAATQREQHVALEQLLQEREKRLQEREDYLNRQEVQLNQRTGEVRQEAERILAEARQTALETRRSAETDAAARIRSAEDAASDKLRQAREAAARTEQDAAALAERLMHQAQEDSDAFWRDVNEALKKQILPVIDAEVDVEEAPDES